MTTTTARQNLRTLLDRGELVVAPGVFDGITAHLVNRTDQPAAYMTGAGVAASGFGLPDIGLVTATEMAERARMLVGILGDIPLIADADTGYGAAMNVVRTVALYEQAGVAAIQLEDQVFPETMRPSGRQTRRRRRGVRTDIGRRARRPHRRQPARSSRGPTRGLRSGLDAAIERANRYARAGADVIFVEAPQSDRGDRAHRPRGARHRC